MSSFKFFPSAWPNTKHRFAKRDKNLLTNKLLFLETQFYNFYNYYFSREIATTELL